MENEITVVIGGGAAGICAAISRKRLGGQVIICEKTVRIGKKLLVTGNGRCNLSNDTLNETCYNLPARNLVKAVFGRFGKDDILKFFHELGLYVYSQDGRIFPVTNQASSVLNVLEMELSRLQVSIEYDFDCATVTPGKNGFIVTSRQGKKIKCDKVIITGGGKSYPTFGSDGNIYDIAKKLGHTIIEPVPCAVPLDSKDRLCHLLQGQRITAIVKSVIQGKESSGVSGELLFTKYGLSGTCILDISESASIAINRNHLAPVFVAADLIPFLDKAELTNELLRRKSAGYTASEMLTGILPAKLCAALRDIFTQRGMEDTVDALKNYRFKITGTRGWNEAEFTAGGINTREIDAATLQSKMVDGVYFAGEVLDVNGKRGGYNLAWAWASGMVSGQLNRS